MPLTAMLDVRLRKNLDFWLLFFTVCVVGIGIATLFSATRESPLRYVQKQTIFAFGGLLLLLGAATVDYARLSRLTHWLYGLNLVALVVVMKFAPPIKGAQRWITLGFFQFQPSETAKVIMIVCLAAYLVRRLETIRELPVLLGSLLYIGVPWALIFKQPDLGTSLVLLAIWFGMVYIAGAQGKHLIGIIVVGLLAFTVLWKVNVIKPYQKARLAVFIDPQFDPKDSGYHIIQSRIAVGSGQVWGKGFGQGSQAHGRFIPENHTDFIFTVVGEEGGFFLSTLLIALYGGLLLRGAMIIAQAEDMFGKLIAAGVFSMYAFHIIVNIGMTIGIMPITGVPLPLVSYGGTSLLINMLCIGLLLSVGMRRHRLVF